MRILPFRRPAASEQPAGICDWSQQELADFYRAHRLLVQNGVSIGMDRGLSDVGEPWMVFFDTATQDVFLHIARIDGRCILVCDTLSIRLSRSTIQDIITAFEGEVRQIISLREEKSSNVLLHPASRIIMSISAVFLLFKLENSQALAKGAIVDPAAAADTARKQDMSVSARVHQVLGRLLDMSDTPAAAAAIAGAILTLEFARSQTSETDSEDLVASGTGALQDNGTPVVQAKQADEQVQVADPLQAQIHGPADEAVQVVAMNLDAKVQIAVSTKTVPATPASVPMETQAAALVEEEAVRDEAPEPESSSRPTSSGGSTNVATAGAAAPASEVQGSASTLAPASVETTIIKPLVLAAEVVTKAAGGSLDTAIFLPDDKIALDKDAAGAIAVATSGIGEVSVANLDLLNASVGLFRETAVSGDMLTSTLVALMANFGNYEVEIADGRVLIEQHDASLMVSEEIGIWTNLMADGSAISVVGSMSVVGDLTGALS